MFFSYLDDLEPADLDTDFTPQSPEAQLAQHDAEMAIRAESDLATCKAQVEPESPEAINGWL